MRIHLLCVTLQFNYSSKIKDGLQCKRSCCELEHDVAYSCILTSDNLMLQKKSEPDTETRDPIEDQLVQHLISSEDGLPAVPDTCNTNESNHLAEPEAERNGTDLSPTSEGDMLRLYEATASDGNSQEHIDHLENAVQECIAENQILKVELKINSLPEDKEKQFGEVVQLPREHATDGASHVEDHQEQQSK